MTDQKLRDGDVQLMTPESAFHSYYEVRTDIPIANFDSKTPWMGVHGRFQPGDKITVCQYDDHSWQNLKDVAVFRVLNTEDSIAVKRFGAENGRKEKKPDVLAKPPRGRKKAADPTRPVLRTSDRGDGAWDVVDAAGNVYDTFAAEDAAEQYVRTYGYSPGGEKAEAA